MPYMINTYKAFKSINTYKIYNGIRTYKTCNTSNIMNKEMILINVIHNQINQDI